MKTLFLVYFVCAMTFQPFLAMAGTLQAALPARERPALLAWALAQGRLAPLPVDFSLSALSPGFAKPFLDFSLIGRAQAQTTAPSLSQQIVEQGLIKAKVSQPVTLKQDEVISVSLKDLNVTKLPVDVSASGVELEGFSRYVTVDNKKIGQLVITGAKKDGKREELNAEAFTAQFDLKDVRLDEQDLVIDGDRAALIEALRRLNQRKEAPQDAARETPKKETRKGVTPAVASTAPSNDQAAQYETPERLDAKKDPKEDYRETTQGCPVRVDFTREQAIQQSRVDKYLDGALSEEGACSDSLTTYPLKKNDSLCKAKIDLEGRQAQALFQWRYNNAQAEYVTVSDCQPDPDKIYPITEKQGVCTLVFDFDKNQAIPQAKLVYTNDSGLEQEVRDCAPSQEKKAVALVETTDGCSIKHDFAAGLSRQMTSFLYQLDGVYYQATPCRESGVTYPHKKVFGKGGNDLCPALEDMKGLTSTLQYRSEITLEGKARYITECAPDASTKTAILATREGCEDPSAFQHDLASGLSYGRERFYYMKNGARHYVTQCKISGNVAYKHTAETVGYQNHDELRAAHPYSRVTIAPGGKPYVIEESVILPGATLIPYSYEKLVNEVVRNVYNGCSVTRETADIEVYRRPDGTEYKKVKAAGKALGPYNVCGQVVKQPVWRFVPGSESGRIFVSRDTYTSSYTCGHDDNERTCTTHYDISTYKKTGAYRGARLLRREDGASITQKSKNTHRGFCYYTSRPGTCPATWTGAEVYGWNQAEGW